MKQYITYIATLRPYLFKFILPFLALLSVYFLFFSFSPQFPPDVKIVEVVEVKKQNIRQTTRLIGTIKPNKSSIFLAKGNGTLETFAQAGHKAKKGELIAEIDNPEIEKNFTLSESSEKIAKQQYERSTILNKSGNLSKQTLEEKRTAWIEAQKTLMNAKIELDKIKFYAPFDGIVGAFKIRNGSQVKEGDQIVSFYDPSQTIIEVDIPLSIISSIKDGQEVMVNEKTYRLTHVQKMLDEETHMFPAYLDYDCNNCIIGSNIYIQILVQEKKDVIVVPYESVFLKNGKMHVYIAKDDKAHLQPITLGIREKDQIEITSGIKVGDIVIARGQARLYPEIAIKIHSPST